MKDSIFTNNQLKILENPRQWKIIASQLFDDIQPVKNSSRLNWSIKNAHHHPQREILITLSGEIYAGIQGKIYPCSPGTVIYFDAFERHDNAYPLNSPDFEHLWVVFIKEHIFVSLVSMSSGQIQHQRIINTATPTVGLPDLSKGFDHIWKDFDDYSPDYKRFKIFSTLTLFVGYILEESYKEKVENDKDELQKKTIDKICLHIDECAGNGINLDEMARIAGYSKYHFHRIFSKYTNTSFHDFINRCRIKRVNEMFRENCSKKEISFELGFSCPAAFSRWFKKHYQNKI